MSTSPTIPAVGPDGQRCAQEVELILPDPQDPVAVAMSRRGIFICRAGQPIARRVDALIENAPGRVPVTELRLGKHVVWDEKRAAYVATQAGHAALLQGRLDVSDTLELSDDIDGVNGALVYDGPLILHHNVLDLAVLKATGNITVHGSIEAAEVHAGGDLHVLHGICGKEKGRVSAHGKITTRFLTNAHVTSGGDMVVGNEIVNSHLHCGGLLKVEQGAIVAGHAVALGGILCHAAGSDVGVKTLLEVGLGLEGYTATAEAIAKAELSRQKASEIRSAVGPLMAHAKSLTAAQKEKATELLFAADEAETHANEALAAAERTKSTVQTSLSAKILVSGLLHPGVVIRFPIAEAMVRVPQRGPLEIVLSNKGGEMHIAVVDRCRNTSLALPSLPSANGSVAIARKILGMPA